MSLIDDTPVKALQKYFGFNEFKGKQEQAINSVLEGKDTFVIMPTGEESPYAIKASSTYVRRGGTCCVSTHCLDEKSS